MTKLLVKQVLIQTHNRCPIDFVRCSKLWVVKSCQLVTGRLNGIRDCAEYDVDLRWYREGRCTVSKHTLPGAMV